MRTCIPPASRRGMTLVLVVGIIALLLALATSLTDISVAGTKDSNFRKDASSLLIGTESLANLGFAYLGAKSDLESQLANAKGSTATRPLMYVYSGSGDRSNVDDALVTAATQRIGSLSGLNGTDADLAWTWVSTVNVEMFGQMKQQDLYRLSATGAISGPARLYVNGTMRSVQNMDTFRRKRVEVLFTPYPTYSFRQAMYARKGYDFMGAATTDSWNSNSGAMTYPASTKGAQGDLTSNGTISVQKSSNVQGTVHSNENIPLPNLTYNLTGAETPLPGPAVGTLTGGGPLTSGRYRCAAINFSTNNPLTFTANAEVTIYVDGPISITKDFDLRSCGNPKKVVLIQNNYNSSLGTTTFNGKIIVGNPDNPQAFQYYTLYDGTLPDASNPTAIDFKMNGSAQFGGVMMAPSANFMLNGTFDFYGALLAGSFKDSSTGQGKVNGSFSFHYDESLGNVPVPFPPTLVVVGWSNLDIPPQEWRNAATGTRWDDP